MFNLASHAVAAMTLSMLSGSCLAENPGLKLSIGTHVLQEALDFWVPKELPKLQDTVIKGGKGSHYTYGSLHLTDITVGKATIVTDSKNQGLKISLQGLGATVKKAGFELFGSVFGLSVHCPGTVGAGISGLDITIDLKVTNANGKPDVKFTAAAKIKKVHVSHIFNAFPCELAGLYLDRFVTDITTVIEVAVHHQLTQAIGNIISPIVHKALLSLSYTSEVYSGVTLDYGLVGPVVFAPKGFALGFRGAFYETAHHQKSPFVPVSTSVSTFQRDGEVMMAEAVLNQASAALAIKSRLGHAEVKFGNTTDTRYGFLGLGKVLYSLCPGCSFACEFALLKAPLVTITEAHGVMVGLQEGLVNVSLVNPNGHTIHVGETSLNATVSSTIGLASDGSELIGSYKVEEFKLYHTTTFSGFKDINIFINYILQKAALPYANKHWNRIPIPSVPNTNLFKAVTQTGNGFLSITTDVAFGK